MIRQKSSLRETVTIECIPNLLPTRRQFSYLEERVTIHDDPFSVSRSPFSPSNENERHAEKEREREIEEISSDRPWRYFRLALS